MTDTGPPMVADLTAADMQMFSTAMAIANRAVVADIETACVLVALDEPGRWYDTRPMLDPREHSPQAIDMATQALAYAVYVGLAKHHSTLPHLVRIHKP